MFKITLVIIILAVILGGLSLSSLFVSAQENYKIPSWLKNIAKWWVEGKIDDHEFVMALQYLVNQGILIVPNNQISLSESVNLEKLLPTKTDVGTKWKLYDSKGVKINAEGFLFGTQQKFQKIVFNQVIKPTIVVTVYKFDSGHSVKSYYDVLITKKNGDYEEFDIEYPPSLGVECFGIMKEAYFKKIATIYCVESELFVYAEGTAMNADVRDSVKDFVRIVLDKI